MSDFVFSTRRRPPGELRAVLAAYFGPVAAAIDERHGDWGSLAVMRAAHDPPRVVMEADGWISVLIGDPVVRIALEPAGRSREGSRREAVHRLLRTSPPASGWDQWLDTGFAALAVDTARGAGLVLTDAMAFIPVFQAKDDAGALVLGTHPDSVAVAAGRVEADPVSAADMIATRCIAFPHTLFRGVTQLQAGTARPFSRDGWDGEGHAYWRPEERQAFRSARQAARVLRDGVLEDVRAACGPHERIALLLSAGEDSRVVLGAVPHHVQVQSFVFSESENREVRLARASARAYGAGFTWIPRGREHYLRPMETIASGIGSQAFFLDVHGFGFHREHGIADFPLVLGGFSSDSHLKAKYEQKAAKGLRLAPTPGLDPELLETVRQRHDAHLRRVAEFRPGSAPEWYRLWPFSMREAAGNWPGNRLLMPIHEPFHCMAVLNVTAGVPAAWKRDRRLFHAAFRPLLARSWYVPHTRSRFPYFGPYSNLLLGLGLRITRLTRARIRRAPRTNQSGWTQWNSPAYADLIAGRERDHPLAGSPIAGVVAPAERGRVGEMLRAWPGQERLLAVQLAYLSAKAQELARTLAAGG